MNNEKISNYPALRGISLAVDSERLAIKMLDLAENLFEN
jgi:hypothetical protein